MGGAGVHVAVDHRVLRLLRVPDGLQPVLLVHQVQHPRAAQVGRLQQLPVHVHQRPAVLGVGQEHAVAHRLPGAAAGHLRDRDRHGADQAQARAPVLPDDLLPADHGPPGRGGARLRVPAQPGRADQPHPSPAAPAAAAVVRRPALHQARPADPRHVDHRPDHDHLPGRAARRAAAALRGGRDRGGRALAAVPARDPADDLAGDLRDDPVLPVLHRGVRHLQVGRPGQPRGRLPPGLAAVLLEPPLPAGLRELPHGLRGSPLLGDVHRDHGLHDPAHPQLAPLGALPRGVPLSAVPAPGPAAAAPSSPMTRRPVPPTIRRRRILMSVANHSVAIALSLAFLLPFVFIVATALMTNQQALSPNVWPHPFVWSNFNTVFHSFPFVRYSLNTITYAGLATVGVVVSCVPVAYALSRLQWRGRQIAFVLVLSTLMLPPQVTIVPLYLIFVRLHWIGSLKPLIIPMFIGDAFSIFLLRQFFLTIPQELSDAARVDGAGELQILTRVIVPLAKPAIAAVALFQFLYSWNDFFSPLVYAGSNPNSWTLAVALQQFTSLSRGVLWNLQMAASVLFMLPVIVIFFFAQKVFVEGVTLTGVKG